MNTVQRLAQETGLPEEVIVRVITDKVREHRVAITEELPPEGARISMSDAARKYHVPVGTIWNWVKDGLVHSFGRQTGVHGNPLIVDERAVATLSALPRRRGPRSKVFAASVT